MIRRKDPVRDQRLRLLRARIGREESFLKKEYAKFVPCGDAFAVMDESASHACGPADELVERLAPELVRRGGAEIRVILNREIRLLLYRLAGTPPRDGERRHVHLPFIGNCGCVGFCCSCGRDKVTQHCQACELAAFNAPLFCSQCGGQMIEQLIAWTSIAITSPLAIEGMRCAACGHQVLRHRHRLALAAALKAGESGVVPRK